MSTTVPDEEFEDEYIGEFRRVLTGRCLWLNYHRDRAAIDLGIHLKRPGADDMSPTRVWFQLKGLRATTHDAQTFARKGAYADVSLGHLREWYEGAEVVYLAIWVESMSQFVARDVRELVEDRWGVDVRWDEVGEPRQRTIRVWIPPTAMVDETFLSDLHRHASMRIDARSWRGQYLGHRLDPLRNELESMEPAVFDELVDAILDAHEFELDAHADPAEVLQRDPSPAAEQHLGHIRLMHGRLFATLRWVFPGSVEYGYDDPKQPPEEGQWFSAHGTTTVLVMAEPGDLRTRPDLDEAHLDELFGSSTGPVVIFVNDTEFRAGPWRTQGLRTDGTPIGLGALSAMVLSTPALYRAFATRLRWRRPVNSYRKSTGT